jgi:two-component system, chemotaxis family, response regulator PixG
MGSSSNLKELKLQFKNAVDLQQNCKIYITTVPGDSWSFYFKKGYLIWATGSVHRFRRLYRLTNKFCPNINCQETKLREQEISELWEYLLLTILCKRGQITTEQGTKIIEEAINEILFDCLQAIQQINQIKSIFETSTNSMGTILRSPLFKTPIAHIDIKQTGGRVESSLSAWKKAGIVDYSPNLAPVIKQIQKLHKAVDASTYGKLFVLIDGKKTLRDLATATQQELTTLASSLLPYIKNRSIALQEVPDQQLANLYFSAKQNLANSEYTQENPNREYIQELELPLIVCVDDNPRICQQITQILNPAGYRLISVNDSLETLMVVLENKPSLIFLDSIMPAINGYEICAQIRKIPAFKKTPIVILSDNDHMIDRVRAKIAGASDFINKPIDQAEVLMLAQQYTQDFTAQTNLISAK